MPDEKITTGRMVAILIVSGFGVASLIARQCVGVMILIGLIIALPIGKVIDRIMERSKKETEKSLSTMRDEYIRENDVRAKRS